MAAASKSGTPSLSTTTPCHAHQIAGLYAGEALDPFDACYINSAGRVMRSIGTAVNAAAKVDGYAATTALADGDAVTLYTDVNVRYGAALTPGTRLYLGSATAGRLDDAATVGGTAPVGYVIDATRVRLFQSRY